MRNYATHLALHTEPPRVPNEFEIAWLFLTGWETWQCEITYGVCKVFFALSSFPFFLFTIGGLNKLFTHTEASAYTRDGKITPIDVNGLSAYLQWLKEDVLGQSRYRDELDDHFPRKKISQLEKAVLAGEQLLVSARDRPATALKDTRKKKADIDALLKSIVTKEAASEALFKKCFPDQLIIEEYKKELEAAHAKPHKTSDVGEDTDSEDEDNDEADEAKKKLAAGTSVGSSVGSPHPNK